MGLLDYIFKSKEQREAEEKRDMALCHQADKLYQEEKDDECQSQSPHLLLHLSLRRSS